MRNVAAFWVFLLFVAGCAADDFSGTETFYCSSTADCVDGFVCHPTTRECVPPSVVGDGGAVPQGDCRQAAQACAGGFVCQADEAGGWGCAPAPAPDAAVDAEPIEDAAADAAVDAEIIEDAAADAAVDAEIIEDAAVDAEFIEDAVVDAEVIEDAAPAIALETITLDLAALQLPNGATQQLAAQGHYSDASAADLTAVATWASTNPLVATVSAEGLVSAVAAGSTTVSAAFDGVRAELVVTVTNAQLLSLTVAPLAANAALGDNTPFTALGRYSDGSERDVTAEAAWAVAPDALAMFDGVPGVARTVSVGQGAVTATLDDTVSPPATLTVGAAALRTVRVLGLAAPLVVGQTERLTATGVNSDGSEVNLTEMALWVSDAPGVVAVSSGVGRGGELLALAEGAATLTASFGGVTSEGVEVVAVPQALVAIRVQPDALSLPAGETASLRVVGTFNDETEQDVSAQIAWESLAPAVASVANDGVVTAVTVGSTRIFARTGDLAAVAAVDVTSAELLRVVIAPDNVEVVAGRSTNLTATAIYGDGGELDVTAGAAWVSSAPGVASVAAGVVSGLVAGQAQITASFDGVESAAAAVSVTPAVLEGLTIAPAQAEVQVFVGGALALSAEGHYSDGSTRDITDTVTWSSDDEAVAVFSQQAGHEGEVLGVAEGQTTVRARQGEIVQVALALTVAANPNINPTARLVCPVGGIVGEALSFNGAASSDVDGELVSYDWDYGQGPVNGAASTQHSFDVDGEHEVSLTVTDDAGGTDTDICTVTIAPEGAPEVRIVTPRADVDVHQGEMMNVTVDVSVLAGRAVTRVALLLDGVEVAEDMLAPYALSFEVPQAALTGDALALVAVATDDQGVSGLSAPRTLNVVNAAPHASFTAFALEPGVVAVNASAVSDDFTAVDALEVRWDWDADGAWDTEWMVDKTTTHDYGAEDAVTITVQVRDNAGQTDEASREVSFEGPLVIGGQIESSVWFGTVVITGDVIVPAGEVLTVRAGTRVLFPVVDQDGDGVGDYGVEVQGQIVIEGTAAAPVLFTSFNEDGAPSDWDQLWIHGDAPSALSHVTFAFGDQPVLVEDASTLDHVTVLSSGDTGIMLLGSVGTELGANPNLPDGMLNKSRDWRSKGIARGPDFADNRAD